MLWRSLEFITGCTELLSDVLRTRGLFIICERRDKPCPEQKKPISLFEILLKVGAWVLKSMIDHTDRRDKSLFRLSLD
jgi:hypothetical protein